MVICVALRTKWAASAGIFITYFLPWRHTLTGFWGLSWEAHFPWAVTQGHPNLSHLPCQRGWETQREGQRALSPDGRRQVTPNRGRHCTPVTQSNRQPSEYRFLYARDRVFWSPGSRKPLLEWCRALCCRAGEETGRCYSGELPMKPQPAADPRPSRCAQQTWCVALLAFRSWLPSAAILVSTHHVPLLPVPVAFHHLQFLS